MTSLTDNNIDEMIRRVRRQDAVSDMAFRTAYPPDDKPDPIDKFTVFVMHSNVKRSQVFVGNTVGAGREGCLYETELTLRTYAPQQTAAFALLRKTSLLFDALEACDSDGAIVSISLGNVAYDANMRAVYRDLRVTLRWLLSGEGEA